MTYPQLLSSIYGTFDSLHPLWTEGMEKAGSCGAFVFLPEDYIDVESLAEATYSYWTIESIKDYISGENEPDGGFLDLLQDLDPEKMFLAMIVEPPSTSSRSAVHLHKITRLGTS
jgi:hypothetical protein